MDLVMDRLSVILLAGISVLAVVHLVLLRKPDPATHPLILGRQSDLDKVQSTPVFYCCTYTILNTAFTLPGQTPERITRIRLVHYWSRRSRKAAR